MAMIAFQLACAALVALWIGVALTRTARPRRLLGEALSIAAGAWVAEATCIWLYGFYAYDPSWRLFAGPVPLAVLCIWPVVILSDRALVGALWPRAGRARPILVGLLVLADAALIEPVSVASGLWRWFEPGVFDVPPVGILGWGLYAGLATAWLDRAEGGDAARLATLPVVCAIGVHAGLLAAWWGALRHVSVPLPGWPAAGLAWAVSAAVLAAALARRIRDRVPPWQALTRAPPGILFLVLLAIHGRDRPDLVAWALAFTPPHLALLPAGRILRRARDDRPARA